MLSLVLVTLTCHTFENSHECNYSVKNTVDINVFGTNFGLLDDIT